MDVLNGFRKKAFKLIFNHYSYVDQVGPFRKYITSILKYKKNFSWTRYSMWNDEWLLASDILSEPKMVGKQINYVIF